MADNPNELELNISVNTSDSEQQLNQLEKKIDSTLKTISKNLASINKIGDKQAYSSLSKSFSEIQKDAIQLKKTLETTNISLPEQRLDVTKQFEELLAKSSRLKKEAGEILKADRASLRLDAAEKSLKEFELSLDPAKQKMLELKKQLELAETAFIKFASAGRQTEATKSGLENAKKQIVGLKKEMDKLQESTHKSSGAFGKLFGRIRNIGIYRTIRSVMKFFTQGISEGLQGLAQYSGEVNDSMSNIKNSMQQVTNTLAISFASVLQSLEPIITTLTDTLVDLVNSFNLALAKMQGKNVYMKAKKSADAYAESAKKAQKFSFDTFEVLSGGDNKTATKDLFDEASVEEDANEMSKLFEHIIEVIQSVGKTLFTVFQSLLNSGILDAILDIIEDVASVISDIIVSLIESGAMKSIIDATKVVFNIIGSIVKALAAMISYLNKIGALKPLLIGIATAFVAIKVAAIGAAIANAAAFIMQNPWLNIGLALAGIAAIGGIVAGITMLTSNVQGFADGGFTTANFIATNENGKREWVGRNAGATAVVNDTQMSDIMYGAVRDGCYQGILQAMYESPSASANGTGEFILKVDSNVLGRVVAESAGFRNEFNRRNASLNIR